MLIVSSIETLDTLQYIANNVTATRLTLPNLIFFNVLLQVGDRTVMLEQLVGRRWQFREALRISLRLVRKINVNLS